MRELKYVLLLDGDNTLWDTNEIFTLAQNTAIRTLSNGGYPCNGGLQELRQIDLALATALGMMEYDFVYLMKALILLSEGADPSDLVSLALSDDTRLEKSQQKLAKQAADQLRRTLKETIPDLLPGAPELLQWIRRERAKPAREIASLLLSEGDPVRIQGIVDQLGIGNPGDYFDSIEVVAKKDRESFAQIAAAGRSRLQDDTAQVLCLGDSLRRDIAPGNFVGAITIYKPAEFLGAEKPRTIDEAPTYVVADLYEALTLIQSITGEYRSQATAPIGWSFSPR